MVKVVQVLLNRVYEIPKSELVTIESKGQRSIYTAEGRPTKRYSGLVVVVSGTSENVDNFLKDKEVYWV